MLSMKRAVLSVLQKNPQFFNPLWKFYYHMSRPKPGRQSQEKGVSTDRRRTFREIYLKNEWGSGESKSGLGSTLVYTARLRRELRQLIETFNIKIILDAPCGDFNWMRHVPLTDVRYIGGDIVPEMIEGLQRDFTATGREFRVIDIVEDPIPSVDLWMCRDVLFHLSEADVIGVLDQAGQSDIKYFLSSSHLFADKNQDIQSGGYRDINLCKAPYNLPRPLREVEDFVVPFPPRVLWLWSREQLQEATALRRQERKNEVRPRDLSK